MYSSFGVGFHILSQQIFSCFFNKGPLSVVVVKCARSLCNLYGLVGDILYIVACTISRRLLHLDFVNML